MKNPIKKQVEDLNRLITKEYVPMEYIGGTSMSIICQLGNAKMK